MFSWFKIFKKESKQTNEVTPPVKVKLQSLKIGDKVLVVRQDSLNLSYEGSKHSVREYDLPKNPLIVVDKSLPYSSKYRKNQVLVKLEDESGQRYNYRAYNNSSILKEKE